MLSKLKIEGIIKVESGLHIGDSGEFAAIGAVDPPVIKDPLTNLPIIPGSSLKGKIRTLLAKTFNNDSIGSKEAINNDDPRIKRLFGATPKDENEPIIIGRLIFRDSILSNAKELEQLGAKNYTEIKFENTIDRFTAVAKPRQIERVIRGSKFNFEIIYDVGNEKEVEEDIQLVKTGFKLLENDYLGGSGSRGYGKVKFENLSIKPVLGDYDVKELNAILEG